MRDKRRGYSSRTLLGPSPSLNEILLLIKRDSVSRLPPVGVPPPGLPLFPSIKLNEIFDKTALLDRFRE